MKGQYWLEKWEQQQIGFHESATNRWLLRYGADWIRGGQRVLVPLCGKSVDLIWLEQCGLEVHGVELAEKAIVDFFAEQRREFTRTKIDRALVFQSGRITLWCADWFALPDELGRFDRVYDRAALIALPPEMRARYATILRDHLTSSAKSLTVTLEYDQAEMNGPPFSVPESELANLFDVVMHCLAADPDALDSNAKFRERGVGKLTETAWLLEFDQT